MSTEFLTVMSSFKKQFKFMKELLARSRIERIEQYKVTK